MNRRGARRGAVLVSLLLGSLALGGCATAAPPIRVGAVFPISGSAASLAGEQLRGVRIAADLVNAAGGIGGRQVVLDVRDIESADAAPAIMASLKSDGVTVVVGTYSSDLSVPASAAADAAGLVYWEAGAVADRLTGRGLPLVFRVGASGTNLGSNSASFAATQLAPRLGLPASQLRLAIVAARDDHATSVADAAARTAAAASVPVVARITYDLVLPQWPSVMQRLAEARPDVIILASHIPDGVAFRQAMIGAGLRVGALIGSTMAECGPDFGLELGAAAVGVFASDRPTQGFNENVLSPSARTTYERFSRMWEQTTGGPPTEEGLAGFTAAWVLFHDVLPHAGTLDATAIAATARTLDIPRGGLPNGAGLKFSTDSVMRGQNTRAAAVIWQWQAVRHSVTVWPPVDATGTPELIPLPA
jgi:branched-chain amino acid transport system substrate-binding protein